jgi:hypothetical protein
MQETKTCRVEDKKFKKSRGKEGRYRRIRVGGAVSLATENTYRLEDK